MRAIAINRKVAKKHLQAQHQRPKVAHCNCRLSRKANKIIFAHRRELCVVSAGGVTWRVCPCDCMFLQRQGNSRHLHIGSGTLGVSTDELFTGSAIANGENGGNKVEHFQSVGFVLVEKVHAVGDLYNVGAVSVCIMLQDELQSSKNERKKEEQCKSNTGVAS